MIQHVDSQQQGKEIKDDKISECVMDTIGDVFQENDIIVLTKKIFLSMANKVLKVIIKMLKQL